MEIAGYFASVFIGISLGLMGSGGSVLTMPVLVYLFGINPFMATTYSLFLVGISSFVGSVYNFKNNLIDFKIVLSFGIPSLLGVYISRHWLLPLIPETVFSLGEFSISKDFLLMIIFSILMIWASFYMIKDNYSLSESTYKKSNYYKIFLQGFIVGSITALVGAGGGFLIIPALIGLLKTSMKKAVATSLFIIAINSVLGFLISDFNTHHLNWKFLISLTLIAIIGVFIGNIISKYIDGKKLKPLLGWMILLMGIGIFIGEFL